MQNCQDYISQFIKTEKVDTANTVRYGRTGYFTFKPEWDKNVNYWGPLILRVMKKHLEEEWRVFGNRSTTSSRRLID